MTTWDEGVEYTKLFGVIQEYAEGDRFHQVKALDLITANYTPFGNLPMEETKAVVEQIFASNGYLIIVGGRPDFVGTNAIVTVAKWSGDYDWGFDLFQHISAALTRRLESRPFVVDATSRETHEWMELVTKRMRQLEEERDRFA